MRDVAMAQVALDGPRVLTIHSQLVPSGVPELVRVGIRDTCRRTGPRNHLPYRRVCQRPLALCREDVRGSRVIPLQAPEGPQLGAM